MDPNDLLADSLDSKYVDEEHILAFEDAINYDDQLTSDKDSSSVYGLSLLSRSSSSTKLNNANGSTNNIELISSQNDWKPVYNRTPSSKQATRKNKKQTTKKRLGDDNSLTFQLLRYPILVFIFNWVGFLSILYLLIRLAVSLSEKILIQTDPKRKRLVDELRNVETYDEYILKAKELDKYLGLNDWCQEDRFRYYDWKTLRKIVNNLQKLRDSQRFDELIVVLQSCLKSNFAGTENPILYSHCYYGTKNLIEKYNQEVVRSLQSIIDTDKVPNGEKKMFFKIINRNFGKTALALSGGASFTYNHYGVLKALLEADLLPNIISGTSGGGIISSLATTRNSDELAKLITPKLAKNINACGDEPMWKWVPRWWKTGARFDPVDWAEKVQWWTLGSMTFKECYERTGKILNISTVPHDIHSPTILCNYITSPNCVIWSTLLASAAVPGILPPVVLMEKGKDGSISPFSFGSRWKDGSLRTDIPIESLNTYFNVKFSIVSQVNPHVLLWFFKNKGDIGKPVFRQKGNGYRGGFLTSYFENLIRLEIIKWLKLIKEFQFLPNLMSSDWSNLFLQKFSGTITLFPKIQLKDYLYILSDPTEARLAELIKNGQSVTYPKLLFIKHRLNIEKLIEKGRNESKEHSHLPQTFSRGFTPDTFNSEIDIGNTAKRANMVYMDSDDSTDYESDIGFLGLHDDESHHLLFTNEEDEEESEMEASVETHSNFEEVKKEL